jgi:hypothetical protein
MYIVINMKFTHLTANIVTLFSTYCFFLLRYLTTLSHPKHYQLLRAYYTCGFVTSQLCWPLYIVFYIIWGICDTQNISRAGSTTVITRNYLQSILFSRLFATAFRSALGTVGSFTGVIPVEAWNTTHHHKHRFHMMTRLKIRHLLTSTVQYSFMTWCLDRGKTSTYFQD